MAEETMQKIIMNKHPDTSKEGKSNNNNSLNLFFVLF
jgi:hypothetical protein